jgi:hypothetical protein
MSGYADIGRLHVLREYGEIMQAIQRLHDERDKAVAENQQLRDAAQAVIDADAADDKALADLVREFPPFMAGEIQEQTARALERALGDLRAALAATPSEDT